MAIVKPTFLGQMLGTTEELAQYKGKPDAVGQIVWNETEKRFVGFDGVKLGGYPMATKQEVDQKQDAKELEDALKELITEYGGSVPQ